LYSHAILSRIDRTIPASFLHPRSTMTHLIIDAAGLTDVGSVRQYNEDSIMLDVERGLMVLADGMGGHRAGEVASRMAVEALLTTLHDKVALFSPDDDPVSLRPVVEQSIIRANDEIFAAAQSNPNWHGMGTTLAVAVFHGRRVTLAHVGDSRIYRLRFNRLQLLTRDDSLLRDQVELGLIAVADAGGSHNRNLVTRAVGIEAQVKPHVRDEQILAGDLYLLCSDGLNDLVDDGDIELIMNSLKVNLPLAVHHLVQAAKDNGGHDNISAILVRLREAAPPDVRLGWLGRLLAWWRGAAG
jgi:serine/threonine protein phosphatase PrpC